MSWLEADSDAVSWRDCELETGMIDGPALLENDKHLTARGSVASEIVDRADVVQSRFRNMIQPEDELRADSIVVNELLLNLTADVFPSGMNGALRRWPTVETQTLSLFDKRAGLQPSWKPHWSKVPTVGLMFPLGFEFQPKPTEAAERDDLKTLEGPKAQRELKPDDMAEQGESKEKKRTRLKPPADAISLEDRLFYLLQPPLQTMLAGQELIMPFEPFPFQYEGIAWLFSQKQALLADEMGLGKTMQTITAIRLLLRAGHVRRVLLICPKPLIPNWQREFKAWAEELPLTVLEGDAARRRMLWQMPAPILLANYELLVRDWADMLDDERPKFDLVVLDEAQRIKNRNSCTSETARSIPRKRSWALTGTPIENRPEELHTLFEYMTVIPKGGTPDLKQMQRLSRDFILRRTKDLVMKDMPPRLDRDEILELTSAQKDAYQTAEKDGVIHLNEMGDQATVQHVFELVLRLKQITNFDPLTGESVKFERLAADMEEIAACGGKAILFSQWTKTIDWLVARLPRECGSLVYHGGVPHKQREPILKQFKEDPKSHLLLMSYGTGAVGLNLQFAGYVFLFDRWWNPAIEDQAINRAHRIGVKSQVIVTKFICKDTIEERIDKVLNEKRDLFRAILGDGSNTNTSLSMSASEIFGLFDLKARHGKGTKKIAPKAAEAPSSDAA